jgi:phosphate transport system substrate-binding protein
MKTKMFLGVLGCALSLLTAAPAFAQDASIKGAGSSFAKPLYDAWSSNFPQGKNAVSYAAVGSGVGINRFQNQQVDFGGSDVAMNDEQIAETRGNNSDILQIPTAYGGIVITYNLPGLKGALNLSGDLLAQIYLGNIRMWNDPRLTAANPSLANVNYPIITFHRGDSSGTTYGFTNYLTATSKDWRNNNQANFATTWPVGDGKGGNGAVVDAVIANPYSIGYADYNYVVAKKLPMASLRNSTGNYVQPSLETIREAVTNAAAASSGADLRFNLIDASGARSYPLVTATYVIVHRGQTDAAKATTLVNFLTWGLHEGQALEAPLNYVPLPDSVAAAATKLVQSITTKGTAGGRN